MKILVVTPLAGQKGGSELALWHLVRYGRNTDVQWVVAFLEDGPMVEQFRSLENVKAHVVDAGRIRELNKMAKAIDAISRLAQIENVDVILGWITTAHLYSGPAALKAKKKAVLFQHSIPRNATLPERIASRIPVSGVLACSDEVRVAQHKITPRLPVRVVYPGVEFSRFDLSVLPSPAEVRRKLGLPEIGPIIGIVGRLQAWKGIHVFVDAFAKIREKYPDATGVIVGGRHEGEPEYEARLTNQITRLDLTQTIKLVGLQKNVPEWMQAMDIVIHASDHEPFGMVIVEAMALEKPVVAGASGGPKEIITPEKDGLLAPFGDSVALADAVLRYLDDPEWARQIGRAAGLRAQDFSVDRYANNTLAALHEWTQ